MQQRRRRHGAPALTGNVLGGLLASVGRPQSGQRVATTPGKFATAFTMAMGVWSALQLNAKPLPPQCLAGAPGVLQD